VSLTSLDFCCFSGEKILVGYDAVKQAEHNPANTLYDAKRFIGKIFTKEELEAEMPRYPFRVRRCTATSLDDVPLSCIKL